MREGGKKEMVKKRWLGEGEKGKREIVKKNGPVQMKLFRVEG